MRLFDKARAICIEKGENLFPSDCIEALKLTYKGRMDNISGVKLREMVLRLYGNIEPDPDHVVLDRINEVVLDFINS